MTTVWPDKNQQKKPREQKAIPAAPANPAVVAGGIGRVNTASQLSIIKFVNAILEKKKSFVSINNKMDAIDIAYARYKSHKDSNCGVETSNGIDTSRAGDTACNVFDSDKVTPPIVVSQVDSYVAYLAEVFLSGSPIFPVVSRPGNRQWAEQLETLLDDHSTLGAYPRQLLMFLRDGVKYNLSALEAKWDAIDQFSTAEDVTAVSERKLKRDKKKFTRIKRINPRNAIWDYSVMPGDVAELGDYAGYVERYTRTKFKRMLNKWTADGKVYNADKAMNSASLSGDGNGPNYVENPQISSYVPNNNSRNTAPDWDAYFDPKSARGVRPPMSNMYELVKIYARIMPSDFGISAPQPNTPQIWEFVICNGQWVVYADRVISAYDYLPILFGQPLEDGLDYQTQSVAEGEIEFQDAASTLFNIRFAAARRAVSDRALYIPDMIKPSDINSKAAAPKIPVSISALSTKGLMDAYHQIPFDTRGTETTIQDATTIVQFSNQLHGQNNPAQGSFQKGNKSVQEWNDTMGGADGRRRLPALVLEHQVFSPLKSMLSLNIFQYGDDVEIVSQKSGEVLKIDINALRKQVLSFKLADGYSPKSKKAGTDVIMAGMQMLMNSPILQQAYGNRLPSMFAHFMSLSGAYGFEEYDPQYAAMQAQQQQSAPGALPANTLQDPTAGAGAVPPAQPGMPPQAGIPPQQPALATPQSSTPGAPVV